MFDYTSEVEVEKLHDKIQLSKSTDFISSRGNDARDFLKRKYVHTTTENSISLNGLVTIGERILLIIEKFNSQVEQQILDGYEIFDDILCIYYNEPYDLNNINESQRKELQDACAGKLLEFHKSGKVIYKQSSRVPGLEINSADNCSRICCFAKELNGWNKNYYAITTGHNYIKNSDIYHSGKELGNLTYVNSPAANTCDDFALIRITSPEFLPPLNLVSKDDRLLALSTAEANYRIEIIRQHEIEFFRNEDRAIKKTINNISICTRLSVGIHNAVCFHNNGQALHEEGDSGLLLTVRIDSGRKLLAVAMVTGMLQDNRNRLNNNPDGDYWMTMGQEFNKMVASIKKRFPAIDILIHDHLQGCDFFS